MLKGSAMQLGSVKAPLGSSVTLAPLPARGVAGQRGRQASTIVVSSRKELLESRLYRRTVADHAYWENYLTTDRYFKNMLSLPSSRIYKALLGPLGSIALTATLVCTYETLRSQGTLPAELPSILMPNNTPLTLTSFAVSLLLVFRTNQSYDRWWEARKIWGGILNRVRDVVTQACVFIPEDEKELRIAMRNWTIAFTRTLEAHLQGKLVQRDLKANLENVLTPKEMDMVMNSQHRVVKCLSVMSEIALQAPINSIERSMLMTNVQFFYDALGMCERIMRTPLPLTYTRHTARFLYFWISSLPFALYGSFGWGCIPVTLVIGTLLMGIDEIGVQIEEPFGVLPLDAICSRGEIDMRSIVDDQPGLVKVVQDMKPVDISGARVNGVPVEAGRRERGVPEDLMVRASKNTIPYRPLVAETHQHQPQLVAASAATAVAAPIPAPATEHAPSHVLEPVAAEAKEPVLVEAKATAVMEAQVPAAVAEAKAPAAVVQGEGPAAAAAAQSNGATVVESNGAGPAGANGAAAAESNGAAAAPAEPSGSKVMQAMQAARAQVEKALQENKHDLAKEAAVPEHTPEEHSTNKTGGISVGVMGGVQLQQDQEVVAGLRTDLAVAHSQLAELSQFLKDNSSQQGQAPHRAAQEVLGGQLTSQQEEMTRLKTTIDSLQKDVELGQQEIEQLRAELSSNKQELDAAQSLRAQMAAREMVIAGIEKELAEVQGTLHEIKVSLSKGLGVPLIGFKFEDEL